MDKKKSTPAGAQISGQGHYIAPAEKSEAEILFDKIGEGIGHAVARPKNARTDRVLRRMISDANASGDCIINVGFGYYRPGDDDCVEFEEYIAKERHRAKEILRKCRKMEQAYNRRYE